MPPQVLFRPSTLLHGADYNPEQWQHVPRIWDEDMRLFNAAKMNSATIGIFSWSEFEPEEGVLRFEWMDEIFERLHKNGQRIILATPSGGKPNWMAEKYPEIRRVGEDGRRELQGFRHNHCPTSPVYREKVRQMNTRLAERYGSHPALTAWHISNELNGHCHCELCKAEFRLWLKEKYRTLDALNNAWWSRFWSHTFTNWQQIDRLDESVHGLCLDWKRFMSHQVTTFIRNESAPLRELSPHVPTTTNMMPGYEGYDYSAHAREVDFVSTDHYPGWHRQAGERAPSWHVGLWTTFKHDHFRAMKPDEPMLLMESTPSQVNWADFSPLKRPEMHRTSNLLALSRGSEGICYFQFRSSRGSSEKYHGTVVSHDGRDDTRVFRDVAATGDLLQTLQPMLGSLARSAVAIIQDYQNSWALASSESPVKTLIRYTDTCVAHYTPFWERGIGVDLPDQLANFGRYRIVITPELHMLLPGTAERLAAFVENGGILVTTYLTGYVDEMDLCFLGGFPGPLRELLGVRIEEIDALPDFRKVPVQCATENLLGLNGVGEAREICELIHAESAEVLATYDGEFYAGMPAITRKATGRGCAYHIAARMDASFLAKFTEAILREADITPVLEMPLPVGVTVQTRIASDSTRWFFLMNFNEIPATVTIGASGWRDVESGEIPNSVYLPANGSRIFTLQ
ncbi:MAG: beta-galactosidase [Gloeobacteraceae cyanobacterium ES-bin-144]|nr:beta-galactosidase [Verrucomicrobiales bacterium]